MDRSKNIFILSALLAVGVSTLAYQYRPRHGWEKKAWVETADRMQALAAVPNRVAGWPPTIGAPFPDVGLFDQKGQPFHLSSLKGKPVLVEFLAMTCAACQAWSGAHVKGPFDDLAAQTDMKSIEEYFKTYTGGIDLFDGSVNFVQLIVYDTSLRPPRPEHLDAWREHFGFDKRPNVYVVSGGEPLANGDSFMRVPGFLLVDKGGIVRYDALGHTPKHNLYTELLPAVPGLL